MYGEGALFTRDREQETELDPLLYARDSLTLADSGLVKQFRHKLEVSS